MVDTGIASSHPDIKGKVVGQRDFVNNDPYAKDDNGHSTHAAGIAAGATNNTQGVAGTCPNCTLLGAKVLDADGTDYMDHIAQGITWSANSGARVISLSLSDPSTTALYNAVNYAWDKGAVMIAAAGNESTSSVSYNYPDAYGNAIAVAATDAYDRRAYYSNYGSWVDVAAPGTSIMSTLGWYGAKSGTSMATPHVAGLAGLLFGQGRSRDQVRYRIERTATDLGAPGRDVYYGYGRINAANAVAR